MIYPEFYYSIWVEELTKTK